MENTFKLQLKPALLAALDGEISAALAAAQQAQATASHEQNKPENQYDTLALEAAYLAHGQSERIHDLQALRIRIRQWQVADYGADDLVGNGALVKLIRLPGSGVAAAERWIWIAPVGGRLLVVNDQPVQVISQQAPLAQQLMQLGEGDELLLANERWEVEALY